MARKITPIKQETKHNVLVYTLSATGIVLILIGIIRAVNTKRNPALESAEEKDDYGDGLLGFVRRLFKHHPKNTGLTDEQKIKIDMQESLKYNAAYFKTLLASGVMLGNAKALLKEMISQNITSPYSQAGLLAVVSKESNFIYKRENLNYDAAGLIKVFKLSADVAKSIEHKPEAIANIVYMPPHNTELGNHLPSDGWAFRGGGPNQITGRAAFEKYGKEIGVDLVSNPDKIDEPETAAKACVDFFKDGFAALMKSSITLKDGTKELHSKYYNNPTGDINKFSNELDAAAAFYNINAGTGQTEKFLLADVTGGRALCMARATGFLDFIKNQSKSQAV
jgi:predicted chitinase